MMATADGIAARFGARAAFLHTLRLASIASACMLAACGGGGSGNNAPDGCAQSSDFDATGSSNLVSLTISNTAATPRRVRLAGRVIFDGTAGLAGAYSTLVMTDGMSPVHAGTVQALPSGRAQGAQDISTEVLLQPGTQATWHLAHAPLPAPYRWASMRWQTAELCAL